MRRAWIIAAVLIVGVAVALIVTRDTGNQRYAATGTILESPDHGPELCLGGVAESYPPQCGGLPLVGWDWNAVDDEESASGTTWTSAYVEGTYDGKRFTLTAPPAPPRRQASDTDASAFDPACEEPDVIDSAVGGSEWQQATQGDDSWFNQVPGQAAVWVSDPSGDDWDGPFVVNVIVRPGNLADATTHIRKYWNGPLCLVERDQKTTKELDAIVARIGDVLTQDVLTAAPNYRRGVVEVMITLVDDQAQREVNDAFGAGVVRLTGSLTPV
jgi:hypothetical protein